MPVIYQLEGKRPYFHAVYNNQTATGSLTISNGVARNGKNHLRSAPSITISIK